MQQANHMQQMIAPLKRYAQFSGRASRREYWMFQLFTLLVPLPLYAGLGIGLVCDLLPLFYASVALFAIFWLGTIVPHFALSVRRLHDVEQSGWMFLLAFVPLGGIVVLVFMLMPGTAHENRFGPLPPRP